MKMKNLLLTLLVLVSTAAFAQLESGKVYRFVNKADANIAMASVSTTEVYGVANNAKDYAQMWLLESHPNNSSAWALRNVGNGLYLRATGTSTVWTFDQKPTAANVLYKIDASTGYITFSPTTNAGSNCMHYATSQGGAVVGWNTGAEATHWKVVEAQITSEELEANWKELDAFNGLLTEEYRISCQQALSNLFEDVACTQLKSSFNSIEALEASADYQALPADLKNMAKKVLTGDWSEPNYDSSKKGWDSEYGKKFRIQSIEPYSIAGEVTEAFGINAHCNMDNPTGVVGNYRQHIYVIVEGEIKNGAELKLGSLAGHGLLNTYDRGTTLREGLNIIPFSANGNAIYINYVVHTYQNGKFTNKLSDYSNIKVHIEGGSLNGYYNAVGDHIWGEPDDDQDWLYYEERANLDNVTILGKRQILQFYLKDTQGEKGMAYYLPERLKVPTGTPTNQKVNTMLEAWDRIHLSELASMGLLSKAEMDSLNTLYPRYNEKWEKAGAIYDYNEEMYANQNNLDYSEYFNHHGVALGNFSGYMSGGWRNCNYHHNTMSSIIGEIATSSGSTWGPAHEIGHQHQSVFTVNGLTEVTNNFHSNVAVWYMGIGTSRVNGAEGSLQALYENSYKNNKHYLFHSHADGSQNLWTQTQMYYKLWLYYHRAGHNTSFFPRLFELNRRNRMSSSNLGWIDGAGHASGTESTLKYYKQACDAAGEDLTEFFRAHGFFVVLEKELRGDYSNSYYTQTQKEIDAAIAYVKAKGYKENLAPLFINDCVNTTTYSHDGKTKRSHWDSETTNGKNAKIGMYTTCMDKSVKAQGYMYNYSGTALSILYTGASGAVGFIIYQGDELIGFTNNYNISLPQIKGDIQVYAVQADGTKVEIPSAAEAGTEEQQRTALNSAINAANKVLSYVTTTGSEVGYYFEHSVATLRTLLDGAKNAYNNNDQSERTYGKWATALTSEINRISSDKYTMANIKELNHFTLTGPKGGLAYHSGSLKAATVSQVPNSSNDRRWEFVSTGNPDEFYIKNVGQNKFITNIDKGESATLVTANKASAAKFVVLYNGDGTLSFAKDGDANIAINVADDKGIIGWSASNSNSKWKVKVVVDNASEKEANDLDALIAEAERTLAEIGIVNGEAVTYNSDVTPVASDLASLTIALDNLHKEAVSNRETTPNLTYYIDMLKAAIESLDGTYVLSPIASANNVITWYYIKDAANGTYCGVDLEASTTTKKLTVSNAELAKDDNNFWWAVVATGNENEYKIYNKGQEQFIYTSDRSYLKVDGAKDAGAYVINVSKENIGISIADGNKFWNNSVNGSVTSKTQTSYWRLVKIGTEEGNLTGIEEVLENSNDTKVIYDLTGRRINEITVPGIYIVNGKKVMVK